MTTKKTLATVILIGILAFSIGYMVNPLAQHFDPKVNVYMIVSKGEAAGASSTLSTGNLITDIGENFAGNAIITEDQSYFNNTGWVQNNYPFMFPSP